MSPAQVVPLVQEGVARAKSAPARVQRPTRLSNAASPIFRHEALEAYQRGEGLASPLAIVPLGSRVLLSSLAVAVLFALLLAALGHVEITSRGRGVLRAREGVQPLLFETGGVIREVLVEVGDEVRQNQLIARLDATALEASVLEAEAQLQAVRAHADRERKEESKNFARDAALLRERAALTSERIDSQASSLTHLEGQHSRYEALVKEGLVAAQVVYDNEQVLAEQRRTGLALRDELARIEQQLVALDRSHQAGETERAQALTQAEARANAARWMLKQTQLVAPRAGRVESLMVAAGEVIAEGTLVARLVASRDSTLVTAFVPERDRGFVHVGAPARIEIDQFPFGEFGSAAATVARISSEMASPEETSQVLGAAAPAGVFFRIELELGRDAQTSRLTSALGSGSLLSVRLPLRERRVIGLVFDPIRKWLD